MDNKQLATAYLGELLDRVLRIEMHLITVETEFYRKATGRGDASVPRDLPIFLDSFRVCIDQFLEVVFNLGQRLGSQLTDDELEQFMHIVRLGFTNVNELHRQGLVHLPRPTEPIELRRFLRMIAKHVLTRDKPDLAVYITEDTTETTYASDPLAILKTRNIKGLVRLSNCFIGRDIAEPIQGNNENGIHVTIARIDAQNPLRWPTLIHEAAHKLFSREINGQVSLEKQFNEWLPESINILIGQLSINIQSWLTEVWCDLFATLVLGPSFFFSQYAAFVTSPCCDSSLSREYPPHACRLRLIQDCLRHRHPDVTHTELIQTQINQCLEIVEYWDKYHFLDISTNYRLKVIYDSMRAFFQEKFFSGPETEGTNFQEKFGKMVRHVKELQLDQILSTQKAIAEGLPAPSKPHRSGVRFAEEPTSIQEVILAAWLDRLIRLRSESLKAVIESVEPPSGKIGRENVLQRITRFDNAVLRSLQLAEWLHVLAPEPPKELSSDLTSYLDVEKGIKTSNLSGQLLNDIEIVALIDKLELRVVPLVDLDQQLGSTSLDIRLGTSFEVYLPAYRRTPDLEDSETAPYVSGPIDLDFLEHVVILPGQIILAHSFEYIKLPPTIAGELEGRSSYARLGLEVHLTAGMIDPGFEGVITFELVNNGPNPIPLFPGLRVAQLRLLYVNKPARPYSSRHTAKYRGLLHHHTSLYMNDPDFKRIKESIIEHRIKGNLENQGLSMNAPEVK